MIGTFVGTLKCNKFKVIAISRVLLVKTTCWSCYSRYKYITGTLTEHEF